MDKLFAILVAVLAITTIADIYTALSGPLFYIVESNPLFISSNNPLLFIFFTLAASIFFLYMLKKKTSLPEIFLYTLAILYLSFGHVVGAVSNIQANNNFAEAYNYIENVESYPIEQQQKLVQYNQEAIEQFKDDTKDIYTPKKQVSYYLNTIGLIIFLPFLLANLALYIALKFHKKKAENL